MGAHFNPLDSRLGDTTHFRALQAFESGPLNLALDPTGPGDLELSFVHIARLMDWNYVTVGIFQCADCAQLQVRSDTDADPEIDAWGFWDTLVPFQNVYEKRPLAYSWSGASGAYYCKFTPDDTGSRPPNPRGVHETLCFPGWDHPSNAWSSCGSPSNDLGGNPTFDCAGPGIPDPSGVGLWVESKFDLSNFVGQRIQVRWIGSSWVFDATHSSYYELGHAWDITQFDDGWWLDDIAIRGTLRIQTPPAADTAPPPASVCPPDTCTDLDEDGYGAPGDPACPLGPETDCQDSNPLVSPGARE